MKRIFQILVLLILFIVLVCGTSFLTDKTSYSNWEIENHALNESNISWAKFEWISEESNGTMLHKYAMNIPCKLPGFSNNFTFQFDLGASHTGVYENTFNSLSTQGVKEKTKIKRLKSSLQFWNNNKYFENLSISFGSYIAKNKAAFVYKNYGEKIEIKNLKDTIHLGSIGADFFKDKILIIDYPNTQFAICDNIPKNYQENLIHIELDRNGMLILPMKIHNKNYRIMFDNGSSIFPLMTNAKSICNYSTSPDIDTIQISSWGKIHCVTGKLIKDTFELAGQKFSNVKVYADHRGVGVSGETDGLTGNALFWDKTIIIDFKNKRFGVK
jgi:hypothetical protein